MPDIPSYTFIPDELLQHLPGGAKHFPFPDRPWWSLVSSKTKGFIRMPTRPIQADVHVLERTDGLKSRRQVKLTQDGNLVDFDGHRARLDKLDHESPLPHPGFRPGQMWAVFIDRMWILTRIKFTVGPKIATDGYAKLITPGDNTKAGAAWGRAILLFDPIIPDRAPWANTERLLTKSEQT